MHQSDDAPGDQVVAIGPATAWIERARRDRPREGEVRDDAFVRLRSCPHGDGVSARRTYTRRLVAKLRLDMLGATAAVTGPALLSVFLWSEAVYGPSQPNGGPLRMALGFTLVTGGFMCFALALLRLHAQAPNGASRIGLAGTLLGASSLVLLTIGTVLWWPILFVWPDLGPLAGAPVGLGTLSLLGAWVLLGLEAAQRQSLPSWLRPLPLALLVLFVLLLVVMSTASPWPLGAPIFATFAAGWVLLAYGIWGLATLTSRPPAPPPSP